MSHGDLSRLANAIARRFFGTWIDPMPSGTVELSGLPLPDTERDPDAARVASFVDRSAGEETAAAVVAAFRLGGLDAAQEVLEAAYGGGDGAFVPFAFVRISPRSGRQQAVVEGVAFRREAGWHRVSRAFAFRLAKEPENELNPKASPKVFEVSVRRPLDAARVAELNR